MIGGRRPLRGRKPADRRVRIERPHAPYFRYMGPGTLVAKPAADVALTPSGRFFRRVRGVVFGRPLSTEEEIGERLSKTKALAIFSSDAISSSAYATEEILRVLLLAGASALFLSLEVVDRDHDPARGRVHLVPPGLSRLPERRRRVHRGQDQPRPDLRPRSPPPRCSSTTS